MSLAQLWEKKLEFESSIDLEPRYGYDIYFLELWFPKNMDSRAVEYYCRYIGRTLADYGVSNTITIRRVEKPFMYSYRAVVSMNYPKGVRGLQKKIIKMMRKLAERGIKGEFSKTDLHSWSLKRIIYET